MRPSTVSPSNVIRRLRHAGRRLGNEQGSAILGFLIMLALIVLVAVLVDLYALLQAKSWAYQVCTAAALQGAAYGRDYGPLYASGHLALDPVAAEQSARAAAQAALDRRGFAGYTVEVRVLPDPGGGTIAGFPPVAPAAPGGSTIWTTSEPAVGVYVALPVPVFFVSILNGSSELTVHAFAAAGLVEASP
ncbi:MAG: hypothetical protein KKB13_20490 [Chloroflexi bacterium]|nr:hypothetical protein [Chloroflexota bacterium]